LEFKFLSSNKKIPACIGDFSRWGDARFGDVPKKIKEVQHELEKINARSNKGIL